MKTMLAYSIAFVSVVITSLFGSFFTKKSVKSNWYQCIKPSFTPPSFIFPIVWTILYILIGIAFAKELENTNNKDNKITLYLLGINLMLNILWCYLYFAKKRLVLSAIVLLCILGTAMSIVIYTNYDTTKYLLAPYIMWLCFALILNTFSIIKQKKCS